MLGDYVWTFETGADIIDKTPPGVSSVFPTVDTVDVALNTSIRVEFTEPMDATTLGDTTFIVENVTVSDTVSGIVTYTGNTATFAPGTIEQLTDLSANSDFKVTINTTVADLAGNQLGSDYSWAFTTGSGPDVTPPTISLLTPPNYATGVAPNSAITAVFSELLDAATVTTATFILEDTSAGVPVTGTVTYTGTTATFTPNSALSVGWHTATLTACYFPNYSSTKGHIPASLTS